ncbi:MAG TPA: hypothetical protein VMR17_25205, partial [Xanthobacteraceae bacterium]|nr:hypothetical protein [Xanthobacteraceae bacterium]
NLDDEDGSDIVRTRVLGVNLGNFSGRASKNHLQFQTLDREGEPASIAAKVVLHAEGVARERLHEARCDDRKLHLIDNGRFELHDIGRGIERIHIHPRETLRFRVEFTPTEGVRDFVVRAIQSVEVRGRAEIVGGQTFVFGKVVGYTLRGWKK